MTRLDHFAELLSQDITLEAISERMGISAANARSKLSRIRRKLGRQAQ